MGVVGRRTQVEEHSLQNCDVTSGSTPSGASNTYHHGPFGASMSTWLISVYRCAPRHK